MWFKHRAWIAIAGLLSLGNVIAAWFAATPAEPWHATTHAVLAVLFGVAAERLAARERALRNRGLPTDATALREQLLALGQPTAETLKRIEQAIDAIAIELERIGEGQRFLTKVLAEQTRNLESGSRSPEPDSIPLLRRPPPDATG